MGHVACMRGKTNADRVLVGKPKVKRQLEDLDIDTILLNLILKKYKGRAWTESLWLRIGTVTGCYEKKHIYIFIYVHTQQYSTIVSN